MRLVTVKEAAILADRDVSRIHAWIREERLTYCENESGQRLVHPLDVVELGRIMDRRRNRTTRRKPTKSAPTPPL